MYNENEEVRRIMWAWHIAGMGQKRNSYRNLGGKTRRKEITKMT
jgi:hypothetical protein